MRELTTSFSKASATRPSSLFALSYNSAGMEFVEESKQMTRFINQLLAKVLFALTFLFGVLGGVSEADTPVDQSAKPMDVGVIADLPYGDAELAAFPSLIDDLNSEHNVRLVVHLGDIKSGRESCSDEWFDTIADLFTTFQNPLVYAIGDNEWTDCHRANNDSWDPLERLKTLRALFFGTPGSALGGQNMQVFAQEDYPENQLWFESRVTFSALHVVGSNNNYSPGTCYPVGSAGCPTGNEAETAAQAAARIDEADARVAANAIWLAETFDLADEQDAVGIALFIQADMWFREDTWGFDSFKDTLAALAAGFDGPIMLINGDSHNFAVNLRPELGDNVTQITVDKTLEDDVEWLRLHVDPRSEEVFTWERVFW
jgi:hypothetical protein